MASRTIPQRELRNNVGEILRAAEAGTEFTITVRGRPVARLVAVDLPRERQVDVDREAVMKLLAGTPVDQDYARDIADLRRDEAPVDDPGDRA